MIDIENCKSLNDIARKLYNKVNYTNREKVKKYLCDNGINWKDWLKNLKEKKQSYCLNCGKLLKNGQHKFCSRKCSVIYNNHLRSNVSKKTKITKKLKCCIFCGKKLTGHQYKFCSMQCQHDYQYNEYINKWKQGKENGLKGEYGISDYIRRYLFEKNECKCEKCGWSVINEFTEKIPLEIHHKDGDYTNNAEENLELLCPNCHSLTETYKSHNKKGRKNRDKYS